MTAMNAWEPLAADRPAPALAPFEVRRAAADGAPAPTPLVFASPHSGRLYPDDMMAAAALDALAIRRSEDAFVDELIGSGPTQGAALICANLARAYIDVNREAFELDQAMFADELPDFARARTARVAAGLGAIARVVSEGQEIYARKLTFAEARRRIDGVHAPYHAALARLLGEAHAAHGYAILIDWHSMPGRAGGVEVVLGDRHGTSCRALLTRRLKTLFEKQGFSVALNHPYAGGWSTQAWGRPDEGYEAIQIEISRALYLDPRTGGPSAGWGRCAAALTQVITRLLADGG